MSVFKVKIVTPDGELFSADAKAILVKTDNGNVQILRSHADYFAPLGTGPAKLTLEDGAVKHASCSGGFISVKDGEVLVVATTFEFSDNIDRARAERAKERAEEQIKNAKSDDELRIAKAKLARALSRLSVASL